MYSGHLEYYDMKIWVLFNSKEDVSFCFFVYFSRQLIWLSSAFRYWPYFLGMWSNVKSGVSELLKCYLDLSSYAPLCGMSLSSVQFSCSVVSDCLQPHGLQHIRPPCPSPTPRVYSNSCPLSPSHCTSFRQCPFKPFAIFWWVISLIIELRGLFISSGC